MDFEKLVDERYTVRSYSEEKVSEEDIRKILEIGRTGITGLTRGDEDVVWFDD
jgi:nitroreductase